MPASRIGKILFVHDDAGNAVIAQAHRMQLGKGWHPPLRMDERAIKDRALQCTRSVGVIEWTFCQGWHSHTSNQIQLCVTAVGRRSVFST
jgi:hypothetical protein